jgi:hypothetical protein
MGVFSRAEELAERVKKNPTDRQAVKELQGLQKDAQDSLKSWEKPALRWEVFGTSLPDLDDALDAVMYESKNFGNRILPILTGACELARLILIALLVRSLARSVRAPGAEGLARMGALIASAGAGVGVVTVLVMSMIGHESKFENVRDPLNLLIGAMLFIFLVHTASLVLPALAAQQAYSAAARRR